MKVAAWNIRGFEAEEKKLMVKELIKEENVELLGLVETKQDDISLWHIRKLWGNQNVDWVHSPANNGAGGILVSWNKEAFKGASSLVTQRWICIFGQFVPKAFTCAVCVVYAPNDQRDRREVWQKLRELKQHLTIPMLLMGDFNEVVSPAERRNTTQVTRSMKELGDLIQDLQLIDLDINQKYTWLRDNAASRLDRMLVSNEFISRYQNLKVKCRARMLSDHFSLILYTSEPRWGPSPFRTLDGWLDEPQFMAIFKKEWIQLAHLPLDQKLKAMKKPLRKWNREVFGHIDNKLLGLQTAIAQLEAKQQLQPLQETDVQRSKALQSQLWLWLARKERFWKQMSRCKILKEGDRNTRYFHLIASIRRKKKMIEKIVVNGVEHTDITAVRQAIVGHFKEQYDRKSACSFDISSIGLSSLTEVQKQSLVQEVTVEDIKEALGACDPSKSPGYDGFNMKCIKHIWPIIGEDFNRCIMEFFATGRFPKAINMTWVTLIPKKEGAVEISEFRPISMVGSIYKVIAKILSRRIKAVISDLVGENQTAFISGRQILDGALIANETVHWLKKKKMEGILLKLDFQKAYDSVNLESLDIVMEMMGFPMKWRQWMKTCLSTARISILVNGAPCKPFRMRRGLRQGDPLSPYLFVLMTEVVNKVLSKAAAAGLFQGVKVGSRVLPLTHLQFADDTLIFCEPRLEFLKNMQNVLYSYQSFSGLTVNYAKSGLIVLGKKEEWAERAANLLRCNLVQLPITYLGVPLGANMRKYSSWQPVLSKIQQRLANWKANCLSRPGKLVLIKAVINSLPIYYLSLFKMPKKVADMINKIQRRFLWSGSNGNRISALVKWEVVQRPKAQGGLGVGDILLKNAALLFKWWWRFACEEGVMWRNIIQSLHEEDQFLLPGKSISTMPGPWRDIKSIGLKESPVSQAFFEHLSVKLGDGERIKFWLDAWTDGQPLRKAFPMLYRLSSQQQECIANMGWFEGHLWRWALSWKQELTSGEQIQLMQLQDILQQHHPTQNEGDQILWCRKRTFTTKSLTSEACKINQGGVLVDTLAPTVWMNIAPPKVEFMLWLALLGKLNTRQMLMRKGIIPQEANVCTFCSSQPEDIDHILLGCLLSRNIWLSFAADLGITMEPSQTFRLFYDWWMSRRISNKLRRKIHILSFFAITWSLWTKRNMMIFKNQEFEHETLVSIIKWRIAMWSKAWKESFPYSAEELVRNFQAIPILFS